MHFYSFNPFHLISTTFFIWIAFIQKSLPSLTWLKRLTGLFLLYINGIPVILIPSTWFRFAANRFGSYTHRGSKTTFHPNVCHKTPLTGNVKSHEAIQTPRPTGPAGTAKPFNEPPGTVRRRVRSGQDVVVVKFRFQVEQRKRERGRKKRKKRMKRMRRQEE